MIAIDAMLVCLDLSDIDEKLVAFTRFLCERLPVKKVYFAHNIKTSDLSEAFRQAFGDVDLAEEIEANINDIVGAYFNHATDYEILVSEEPNTEVILADLVRRYGVKLTLLGKRMSEKSTGAQGTKLLRILPCSMLVLPETAKFQLTSILTPIDFSNASGHALRLSKDLAAQFKLSLKIIHVYKLPTQYFPFISEEKLIKKAEEVVKGKFTDLQKRHKEIQGVPFILVRAAGKTVAERIYLQLHQEKHDLVILGLKGNNPVPSLSLGSVATELYNMDINVPIFLVYSEEVIK